MTKTTVTRLVVGGAAAIIAGLFLGLAAVLVAYAGNAFVMTGHDVSGLRSSPFAWAMVAVMVLGALAAIGGAAAGFVAWIGALLNTAPLTDKSWFIVLLVLGLISFGTIAMIAYLIAGPDGTEQTPAGPARHALTQVRPAPRDFRETRR